MPTAVLMSGGLDSAVLLAEQAQRGQTVHPLYVRVGLAWEDAEQAMVVRFLAEPPLRGRTRPVVALTLDMRDVYALGHWAIEGRPPGYHTPDEDVYLPGRNITLLAKAAIFCAAAGVDRLVIGTLAHNPFPDATVEFRASMATALSRGLAHPLTIDAPYASLDKPAVIRRGAAAGLRLDLTLSCMSPKQPPADGNRDLELPWAHCGICSKCRERHDAFIAAGVPDPTTYLDRRHVGPGSYPAPPSRE